MLCNQVEQANQGIACGNHFAMIPARDSFFLLDPQFARSPYRNLLLAIRRWPLANGRWLLARR